MVKIKVARAINFNELINSKEAEVVSMRILNETNSFNGNGEISVENNKKSIKTGDFLEVLANNNYSVKSLDTLKLIEIGEKIGDETMENQTLKMLESASAFSLADCVDYKEGQIVSKNLVAKANLVITVMSFWKGESLDPHKAPGDALVTVLDGEGKYIVDGANIPHAVEAETQNFKMMLTLVK